MKQTLLLLLLGEVVVFPKWSIPSQHVVPDKAELKWTTSATLECKIGKEDGGRLLLVRKGIHEDAGG